MAVLEARGITKSYRRGPETVRALTGADLTLEPGEVVALIGPSGSGKTTLLNVLAGWEQPDEGVILWRGIEEGTGGTRLAELPWSELSVLPQRLGLLDELSVRENVELPLRLGAAVGPGARDRMGELLEELGLSHLADRPPSQTSLGEQQRAALARAVVTTPLLVLADEPAGHQDAVFAERVLSVLRSTAAQGTACLVATHNRDSLRFCDHALEIVDGRMERSLPTGACE